MRDSADFILRRVLKMTPPRWILMIFIKSGENFFS